MCTIGRICNRWTGFVAMTAEREREMSANACTCFMPGWFSVSPIHQMVSVCAPIWIVGLQGLYPTLQPFLDSPPLAAAYGQLNKFITFCVSSRRRKTYCGHARLCVCLSVCVCVCVCLSVRGRTPTILHELGCNLGAW